MSPDESNRKNGERCSFCGRMPAKNHRLFTGTQASICENCVSDCSDMMAEAEERKSPPPQVPLPKPTEIKAFLDQFIADAAATIEGPAQMNRIHRPHQRRVPRRVRRR